MGFAVDSFLINLFPERYRKQIIKYEEKQKPVSKDEFLYWLLSLFTPVRTLDFDNHRLVIGYTSSDPFFTYADDSLGVIGVLRSASHGCVVHELCHYLFWLLRGKRSSKKILVSLTEEIFCYTAGWLLDDTYVSRESATGKAFWEKDMTCCNLLRVQLSLTRFEFKLGNLPFSQIIEDTFSKACSTLQQDRFRKFLFLLDRGAWNLELLLACPSFEREHELRTLIQYLAELKELMS